LFSDNGPQFASEEFSQFYKQLNITHIRSTPYHPRTNGLAERLVRTFKERIRAAGQSIGNVDVTLNKFLFSYRNTPQKATKRSPTELLFGRRLRSSLDNMFIPDVCTCNTLSDTATRNKTQRDAQLHIRAVDSFFLVVVFGHIVRTFRSLSMLVLHDVLEFGLIKRKWKV